MSALVFPGVGHLYLKKYLSGVALASVAGGALYFLTFTVVERALIIVEKIQLGDVPPDIDSIAELLTKQSAGADSKLINIATIILLFSWVIGIADSYLAGRERKTKDTG